MQKASRQTEHLSHTQAVSCAFCRGGGKDPFRNPEPGILCPVCEGRRVHFIQAPYQTCSYCHGSGIAFNTQETCTVCHGRGVISLASSGAKLKSHPCSHCRGTGMDLETNLPCARCAGTGQTRRTAYVARSSR